MMQNSRNNSTVYCPAVDGMNANNLYTFDMLKNKNIISLKSSFHGCVLYIDTIFFDMFRYSDLETPTWKCQRIFPMVFLTFVTWTHEAGWFLFWLWVMFNAWADLRWAGLLS
jgi:hypothetical protein